MDAATELFARRGVDQTSLADVGQDVFTQARRVVRTQTCHAQARKRNIGQCLMLHARGVFVRGAALPDRLGDDADMPARVTFDKGELRCEDPAGIAAESHDVGHRHVRRRVTQFMTQRRQPVARHRDQHRIKENRDREGQCGKDRPTQLAAHVAQG